MAVALESLRRVAGMDRIEQALIQEYRVSLRALAAPDFAEGIRAQVIDKDRKPAWHPPAVEDVTTAVVDAYFAPLGERELALSQSHR
jgi:enoyl-CoA hydratase